MAATTARATSATTTRVGTLTPMPAAISSVVSSKGLGPQRVSGTVGTAATSSAMKPEKSSRTFSSGECPS